MAEALDRARLESAALFAELFKGNNQLQTNFKPRTSEYKDKYIRWAIEGSPISHQGADANRDSIGVHLASDGVSAKQWESEVHDKYKPYDFAPSTTTQLHMPKDTPKESPSVGHHLTDGVSSAAGWSSEARDRYLVDPSASPASQTAGSKSKDRGDVPTFYAWEGQDQGGSAGAQSEYDAKYVSKGVQDFSLMVRGKHTPDTLGPAYLKEEVPVSAWKTEEQDKYQPHAFEAPQRPSHDVRFSSAIDFNDGSSDKWSSEVQDKYSAALQQGSVQGGFVAGSAPPDRADIPMNYAWSSVDQSAARNTSEYASEYAPNANIEDAASASEGGTSRAIVSQNYAPAHAKPVLATAPIGLLPAYMDASKWRSTYDDLCASAKTENEGSSIANPVAGMPTSPTAHVPVFFAWGDRGVEGAESEYDARYKSTESAASAALPAARNVVESTSPLPSYADFANASAWSSTSQAAHAGAGTIAESRPVPSAARTSASPLPAYSAFTPSAWLSEYDDKFRALNLANAAMDRARAERERAVETPLVAAAPSDPSPSPTPTPAPAPAVVPEEKEHVDKPAVPTESERIPTPPVSAPTSVRDDSVVSTPRTEPSRRSASTGRGVSGGKENRNYQTESSVYSWPESKRAAASQPVSGKYIYIYGIIKYN